MHKYFSIILIAFIINVPAFSQKANTAQSLFEAIKNNDIKLVRSLLDQGANPNYIGDDSDNLLALLVAVK